MKTKLNKIAEKYKKTNSIATIGFHYREDIENCGVAEFGKAEKITLFIEKPHRNATKSRWVNSGVYLLQPDIFNYIPTGFSDFGKDIFPKLLIQNIPMYGVLSDTKVLAFDTQELLEQSKGTKI